MRVRAKTVTKTISKTVQQVQSIQSSADAEMLRVKASTLQPGTEMPRAKAAAVQPEATVAVAKMPQPETSMAQADLDEGFAGLNVAPEAAAEETYVEGIDQQDLPSEALSTAASSPDSLTTGNEPLASAWISELSGWEDLSVHQEGVHQVSVQEPTADALRVERADTWGSESTEFSIGSSEDPNRTNEYPDGTSEYPNGSAKYGDESPARALALQTALSLENHSAEMPVSTKAPVSEQPPDVQTIVQTICEGRPYTVRRGDSYQLIARRFGVSTRALLDANPELQPGRLMVGDVLCIPQTAPTVAPSASSYVPVAAVVSSATVQPSAAVSTPAPMPVANADPHRDDQARDDEARHCVAEGESIADILLLGDVSLSAFQDANPGLRLGQQRVGDYLRMPMSGTRGQSRESRPVQVEESEDVHRLAERLGVSVGMLLRTNPHLRPSDFRAGQVVLVVNDVSHRG